MTLAAYQNKVVAIAGTSPGGLRGLVPLRMMLGNIGATVLAKQLAIAHSNKIFDANGILTDEFHLNALSDIVGQLISPTETL
ncbi:MAG: hypothetical protein JKY14_05350 [Paraglaciecola sp.]|nr:hypothetical protein [Paraglaciecola sp.]